MKKRLVTTMKALRYVVDFVVVVASDIDSG
jgi:hypothetical protein